MTMKYVIVATAIPIIFHSALKHDEVMKGLRYKATSAGFCDIYSEGDELIVSCHGRSESLDLESDPEKDKDSILKMLEGLG